MIRLITILMLLFITCCTHIQACSCTNVPKVFSTNIRANHVMFMGTVLEQIEIPIDSNYLLTYHGLTKIKVEKWYQNQMQVDTIYYANGQGAMCTSSIEYLKKGDQMIIKALKKSINDPSLEYYPDLNENLVRFMDAYKNKPTVGYGICDVSILTVKDQMVIGDITINYQHRIWSRTKFIKRISKKWAKKMEARLRKNKPKYQEWELSKFSNLLKVRWNAL